MQLKVAIAIFSCTLLHIASGGLNQQARLSIQDISVLAQQAGVCPDPIDPEFGKVTFCDTYIGDTAIYCCSHDYALEGDTKRICQSDKTWSGTQPVCRYTLACAQLLDPANGNVTLSSGTDIGSVATYACDYGYTMNGSDTRTCEVGGLWSGNAPVCEVVQCDALTDPANGTVYHKGVKYNFGESAKYTCDAGFQLTGNDTLTCQADGQYSSAPPTCEIITCGTPPDIVNGTYVLSDGTNSGSIATYTCNAGYQLRRNDQNILTCNAGKWIGKVPQCNDINECKTNKGGCDHFCTNTIGSYYCHCKDNFFLLPDQKSCERINISLAANSPMVGEGSVEVHILKNDDRITKMECQITCNRPQCPYPVKDCTNGVYTENGMTVGLRHCIHIKATIDLGSGNNITYKKAGICFISGSDTKPYCAINRIGETHFYASGNLATVDLGFAGSGPITSYGCSYDNGATFAPCTSRWTSDPSNGPGEVLICPVSQTCFDKIKGKNKPCKCLRFKYDTTAGKYTQKYLFNKAICLT